MTRKWLSAGVIGFLAMALLFGSCSDAPRPSASRSNSAANLESRSPGATAQPSASLTQSPGSLKAISSPSPRSSPTVYGAVAGSRLRLEVRMASCLERGRLAMATIVTAPGTMLGASATYADGDSHNNYWLGVADARGEYPVTWTPPPDAPLGPGKFLVGGTSETYGGNTLIKEFRLAELGGCP